MKKTTPILLLLVSVMAGRQVGGRAGRQAGRQADKIQVGLRIFKIVYRFNYSGFYFVYYHCSVTTELELHFNHLLSSKAYFKVCFEVRKFSCCCFHVIPYY